MIFISLVDGTCCARNQYRSEFQHLQEFPPLSSLSLWNVQTGELVEKGNEPFDFEREEFGMS